MNPHPLESLSALLDGELKDAERRAVEAHLAACASCARHLRELTAVDALARGLPPVAAPDGYLEALPGRVRKRIRADRLVSRRPVARAAWLWPLAAGLALAVVAPIVLRDGPAPTPPADDRGAAQARISPVSPAALPVRPEEEAPPHSPRDFVAEKDTRPPARARQDAPERRAPADARDAATAAAAPPPPAAESLAAAGTQTASGFALRDEAPADAAGESKLAEARPAVAAQVGGVASLRKAERGNVAAASDTDSAFQSTAALPLSTAPEARRARQAWLRFLADHPRGAQADEARVRLVEASVAAFRVGADPADRLAAERDASAYLNAPPAPQAARVRAVLRRLDEPR